MDSIETPICNCTATEEKIIIPVHGDKEFGITLPGIKTLNTVIDCDCESRIEDLQSRLQQQTRQLQEYEAILRYILRFKRKDDVLLQLSKGHDLLSNVDAIQYNHERHGVHQCDSTLEDARSDMSLLGVDVSICDNRIQEVCKFYKDLKEGPKSKCQDCCSDECRPICSRAPYHVFEQKLTV